VSDLQNYPSLLLTDIDGEISQMIAADEFPVLARFIATVQPPIPIPSSLIQAVKRAIKARQQSYDYYSSLRDAKPRAKDDAGHLHFINVWRQSLVSLESCFMMPYPARQTTAVPDQSQRSPPHIKQHLTSLPAVKSGFKAAAVEDEVDDETSNACASVITNEDDMACLVERVAGKKPEELPDQETRLEYEAEPMSTKQEMMVAARCLLVDINQLRDQNKKLWSQYKAGLVDLTTVSTAANTMVDVVQRLELDFNIQFPAHPPIVGLLEKLYLTESQSRGQHVATRGIKIEEPSLDLYETYEWALSLPCKELKILPGSVNQYTLGQSTLFGAVVEPNDVGIGPRSNARELFSHDTYWLRSAMRVISLFHGVIEPYLAEDRFTQGVKAICDGHKISLWHIFAAQIYVDVRRTLATEMVKSFTELQGISKVVRQSVIETIQLHDTLTDRPKFANPVNMGYFKNLAIVDHHHGAYPEDKDPDVTSPVERHVKLLPLFLLQNHPILCGLLTYQICQYSYANAVRLCNLWGSVTYTAHLYSAVREESACSQQWSALEQFMPQYFEKELFSGPRPRCPYDYQLSVVRIAGFTAMSAAQDLRATTGVKKPETALDLKTPIGRLLMKRICPSQINNARAGVEYIASLDAHLNIIFAKSTAEPWRLARLSPVEFIDSFVREVEKELPIIQFDLNALHRQAVRCTKTVYTKLLPTLTIAYGEDIASVTDIGIATVIPLIFGIANGLDQPRLGQQPLLRLPYTALRQKILKITGAIMNQYLEERVDQQGIAKYKFDEADKSISYLRFGEVPEFRHFGLPMVENLMAALKGWGPEGL
jgi:hypothetical protein